MVHVDKSILGTARIVTFRNGFKGMIYDNVLDNRSTKHFIVNPKLTICIPVSEFNENLECSDAPEYDIVKVEALNSFFDLNKPVELCTTGRIIWERPTIRHIQKSEIKRVFDCIDFVIVDDEI